MYLKHHLKLLYTVSVVHCGLSALHHQNVKRYVNFSVLVFRYFTAFIVKNLLRNLNVMKSIEVIETDHEFVMCETLKLIRRTTVCKTFTTFLIHDNFLKSHTNKCENTYINDNMIL